MSRVRGSVPSNPSRGEIWIVDLSTTRGHEQEGESRPCLVVSANELNTGPSELAIVIPITKSSRGIPFHVEIDPSESGLDFSSFIMCEQIRSLSRERLRNRIGKRLLPKTMIMVEAILKTLLSLR